MPNTLIIGKDFPDIFDFTDALASSGRIVFGTGNQDSDSSNSDRIFSCNWNKSSAISAHSLLINAETKLNKIDEVIFYFDTNYFCSMFEQDKTEEISTAVDILFSSFLYITNEIIKRAEQRKEKISVAFLVKEYPSKYEVVNNASKMTNILPAASIVSAAEASFISLAQNFAAYITDHEYLSVILAKCSFTNDLYKNEKEIALWLAGGFDTVAKQKKQSAKLASNWNKVGGKIQTGFSLFK